MEASEADDTWCRVDNVPFIREFSHIRIKSVEFKGFH
jgi:hypothetical protein